MLVRLLRQYLRPYRLPIVLLLVLQAVQTLASLYLPTLNADIIDSGVLRGDTGYIWRVGGWMLVVSFVQVLCAVGAVYLGARTAMGFGRDLRRAEFTHVETFSQREVGQFGAPSLITRTTNDVQQVQMLVLMSLTIMVMAPIMMIGGIVLALRQDVPLSSILLVIVPVLGVVVGLIISRMVPYFRAMQRKIDDINGVLREQIAGIRVIRAFVTERREERRFGRTNMSLYEVSLRAGYLMALMFPAVMLVLNASSVAVLWFGAHRIDSGGMQIGALTAFLSYIMYILMAVMMSTFMFMMVPRASVSADRIAEVLDTETSVVPPSDPVPLGTGPDGAPSGSVVFDAATFAYPGAENPVLHEIAFEARPGETTAIIGSTGSGKSTLLSLVPRLFDVTGGAVRVGGVDVRELDPEQLDSIIGLVPQKAYLFSGTVADNLRYGKQDATEEEMWTALEVAQARTFVEALDGGLQAPVAQGGTNFSGGQRQRLAIARAVVRRPRIFLFDDSFSALDYATDAALRAALVPHTLRATVLTVAQRVATIRDAEQIVVLDEGRVVGTGTHHELLESCPTYQEIVYSQLSVEEAA